jgi:hypothetical protein
VSVAALPSSERLILKLAQARTSLVHALTETVRRLEPLMDTPIAKPASPASPSHRRLRIVLQEGTASLALAGSAARDAADAGNGGEYALEKRGTKNEFANRPILGAVVCSAKRLRRLSFIVVRASSHHHQRSGPCI